MLTSTFLRKNGHSDKRKNEGGFIILTVPIVLILFAFFVTSITKDTKPNQFYAAVTTQQKLENVRTALANYAHQNYRVPCPSNPVLAKTDPLFGAETPVDANNKCANTRGIIPFKTLGLSEDLAKDAWGFYLTYKVSPDFTTQLASTNAAQFTEAGDGAETLIVPASSGANHLHEMCRTANWTNASGTYRDSSGSIQTKSGSTNENIFKARFCCASNTNGGGQIAFLAADQEQQITNNEAIGQETKVLNLDSDGDGVGDNIIEFSIAPLDKDIALWDETAPYCYTDETGACGTVQERAIDGSVRRAPTRRFDYNAAYEASNPAYHTSDGLVGLGDGLGPQRFTKAGDVDPEHTGKFFWTAALFEITDNTRTIQEIDFAMSDVGSNNEGDAVQTTVEIVDLNGNPVAGLDTVSVVLALPQNPVQGVGNMSFSLDMFKGDADQAGLYHQGVDVRWIRSDGTMGHPHDLPASHAEDLFNDSKARLTAALSAAGLTLDDIKMKSLKVNSTHASLGFSSMSFGTASTPSNTDLVIMDENDDPNNPRLPPRDNQAAYGSADQTHTTTIDPSYEAAAYAVISHGSDGVGSYMVGTPNQFSTTGPDNPWEIANASTDDSVLQIYDVRQIPSSDPLENFDDIVVWDSQISLYKTLRNGTCTQSQAL